MPLKVDLIVGEGRKIGTLLLITSQPQRPTLKLMFAVQPKSIGIYKNPEREAVNRDASGLVSMKKMPGGASMDLSYKFADQKLEWKVEMRDGSIERTFYDIAMPAIGPLALLRIKNLDTFPEMDPERTNVLMTEGLEGAAFNVALSFEADNGNPWMDQLMEGKTVRKIKLVLPEMNPGAIHVITAVDENPIKGYEEMSIWLPEVHKVTKRS